MSDLKYGSDGNLLYGATGLVTECPEDGDPEPLPCRTDNDLCDVPMDATFVWGEDSSDCDFLEVYITLDPQGNESWVWNELNGRATATIFCSDGYWYFTFDELAFCGGFTATWRVQKVTECPPRTGWTEYSESIPCCGVSSVGLVYLDPE